MENKTLSLVLAGDTKVHYMLAMIWGRSVVQIFPQMEYESAFPRCSSVKSKIGVDEQVVVLIRPTKESSYEPR